MYIFHNGPILLGLVTSHFSRSTNPGFQQTKHQEKITQNKWSRKTDTRLWTRTHVFLRWNLVLFQLNQVGGLKKISAPGLSILWEMQKTLMSLPGNLQEVKPPCITFKQAFPVCSCYCAFLVCLLFFYLLTVSLQKPVTYVTGTRFSKSRGFFLNLATENICCMTQRFI